MVSANMPKDYSLYFLDESMSFGQPPPEQPQAQVNHQDLPGTHGHREEGPWYGLATGYELDIRSAGPSHNLLLDGQNSLGLTIKHWKPSFQGDTSSQVPFTGKSRLLHRGSIISLDHVVEARGRADAAARASKRRRLDPQPDPQTWERITSPPSSPSADSALCFALPPTSKARRTLEWACAMDRALRKKKRRRRHNEQLAMGRILPDSLPALPLENGRPQARPDSDETEVETEEAVTPDSSEEFIHSWEGLHHILQIGTHNMQDVKMPGQHGPAAVGLLGSYIGT